VAVPGTISSGRRGLTDDVTKRIYALTKSYLVELGQDASGWETLFRDPKDGRYWERTYPQGELQGGGPPQLICLSADEARKKYGIQAIEG